MSRSRPRISDGWLIAFGTWIAEAGAEMPDRFTAFRSWVTFAGCVLVVAVLYWAQAVLVPVALSILIQLRADPAGPLPSAPHRPSAGDSPRCYAGVLGSRPGYLRHRPADGELEHGPDYVPREHPRQGPGRARRWQGRLGGAAAIDAGGHQKGYRRAHGATGDSQPAGGRVPRRVRGAGTELARARSSRRPAPRASWLFSCSSCSSSVRTFGTG